MDFNFKTGEELFQTILLGILIIFTLILLIVVANIFMTLKAVLNEKAGIKTEPFTLTGFWNKMNSLKPMTQEEALLLHHDYDGIKELDNHLPPWWLGMFYGCIVFGVIYLLNYHVWHWSPLSAEEYEIAMTEAAQEKSARQSTTADQIDENSVVILTAETDVERGKTIYTGSCAVCHGQIGEGGVGPNLTDEYWLHGGSINDVFKTIKYGVTDKGMIAWEGTLKPTDIQQVSSYIISLQGSSPANAKAPQGEKYVPAEENPAAEAPAADGTAAL